MKLEIGSGLHPRDGYTHLDVVPTYPHVEIVSDARKIPLDNNSCTDILSIHVLEHFIWHEVPDVLAEWSRLLVKGGTIELGMPNLNFIFSIYNDKSNKWREYSKGHPYFAENNKWGMIQHMLYGTGNGYNQHKTCFTYEALIDLLAKNNFYDFKKMTKEDNLSLHLIATKK